MYKGEENVFDFSGPDSANNSSIIIGRNAQGKSALFEAIRFVLYGRMQLLTEIVKLLQNEETTRG